MFATLNEGFNGVHITYVRGTEVQMVGTVRNLPIAERIVALLNREGMVDVALDEPAEEAVAE